MRKKWMTFLAAALACSFVLAGCGTKGAKDDTKEAGEDPASPVATMAVADAVLGEGERDGFTQMPQYDEEEDAVVEMITGASVEYTVPEDVEGTFDIYLQVGKMQVMSGETIFDVVVNDGDRYVLPIKVVRADQDQSDRFDLGTFLMAKDVALQAGDSIKIVAKSGFCYSLGEGKFFSFVPPVGDLMLYEAGSQVPVGYDGGTLPATEETDPSDPLSGKTICWLGSSVTYGASAEGYSMADVIEEDHANTTCLKYAISGTTLANIDSGSYVARMKSDIDPELDMDLMVVQLSTNDATKEDGPELGAISESKKIDDFDDTTVIGAMETIIAYTQETWGCPVVFYTGTQFDNEKYAQMVDALYLLQEKWDIGLVDLWGNEEMTAIIGTETYDSYMADEIHPNQTGYQEWWTPEFEKVLPEYLADQR